MFLEFSSAFSIDFGRRRKNQLPDGLTLEEIEFDVDDEPEPEPKKTAPKLGFQRNEERSN